MRPLDDAQDGPLAAALRQFHEALAQALPAPDTAAADADGPADAAQADAAAQALQRLLMQQLELALLGLRAGAEGRSAALVDSARYLMAAHADETLLHRPWPGRRAWPRHLLETVLFGTGMAGDKVIADIERLLDERAPAQRGLARLYLDVLALGFRGRWRGQDDEGRLAALRRELFQFAYQRLPALAERGQALSPQPYAHTLSHAAPRRVAGWGRWVPALALAAAALLVASEVAWLWPTWSLRGTLAVLDAADTGGRP